jgi:hypothetical protein
MSAMPDRPKPDACAGPSATNTKRGTGGRDTYETQDAVEE